MSLAPWLVHQRSADSEGNVDGQRRKVRRKAPPLLLLLLLLLLLNLPHCSIERDTARGQPKQRPDQHMQLSDQQMQRQQEHSLSLTAPTPMCARKHSTRSALEQQALRKRHCYTALDEQ